MRKDFLEFLVSINRKPTKILHVGANTGQEVSLYDQYGLEGWHVEAIPELYRQVADRCKNYPSQHAINACLSNVEGVEIEFNIASNNGQSSSILELGRHAIEYPGITYQKTLVLKTRTIDGLIREDILPEDIDFLLLDTQGAEGLVLEGAQVLLKSNFLLACQIETGVVPLYENGSSYLEIASKLSAFNLHLKSIDFNKAGWTDALFCRPFWSQGLKAGDYVKIEVLRPKPSPAPLIRIGGDKDGAYLLPDDLQGVKACFSPGVSNRKDFEDELLDRYGIASHMCDYSSDPEKFRTPLKLGQTFKKKWLDVNGSEDSISLEDWVQELAPDANDDLILQMDIEGAEYRNLLKTSDAILRRFRIIVIELHRLGVCNRPADFNKELGSLLERFDEYFLCVHAHPNNCGGDFQLAGSKLNLPNVHELTFLRRDRWKGVAEEDCYAPMLPHPLDIAPNVPKNPPVFLNEHWLASGERAPESTIKLLTEQVGYLSRALKQAQTPTAAPKQEIVTDLHRLAQHVATALPVLSPKPAADALVDLAQGKPFILSSQHAACPKGRQVTGQRPFFFHTGEGRNQSITIDLGAESRLFELRIANRANACQERARCLFYCLHDEPKPDFLRGFPVAVDEGFLTKADQVSVTDLRGCQARYLTIFSPETTMLHFSTVQILGVPSD